MIEKKLPDVPEFMTHYYESSAGPLLSLTRLSSHEVDRIQNELREKTDVFASQRKDDYLRKRFALEKKLKELFLLKKGKAELEHPHYFILGECDWLMSWYRSGAALRVDLNDMDKRALSFTYGDSYPTFYYNDDKPYRKQLYTYDEIFELIAVYGLPQEWNPDGKLGPERYIEVQVWMGIDQCLSLGKTNSP